MEEEAIAHEGSKGARAIYLKNGLVFTTGERIELLSSNLLVYFNFKEFWPIAIFALTLKIHMYETRVSAG